MALCIQCVVKEALVRKQRIFVNDVNVNVNGLFENKEEKIKYIDFFPYIRHSILDF